jgi:hypothetical protein
MSRVVAVATLSLAVAVQTAGASTLKPSDHRASATATTRSVRHGSNEPNSTQARAEANHQTPLVVVGTTASGGRVPTQDPASDNGVPDFGPRTSFTADEQWVERALADRLSRLASLSSTISASTTLQSKDRTSLDALVGNAQSVCTSLQQSVSGDFAAGQLQAAADELIESLHVYSILTPQVDETVVAEADNAAAAKLQTLAPGLNTAIAAAQVAAGRVGRLQTLLQGLSSDANAAASITGSVPARLIPLRDANQSAASPVLSSAVSELGTAASDLSAADSDLRRLLALLAK